MSNGRLEFISERTSKRGIPSDPTERCSRCCERAFQHDVLSSGGWGCREEALAERTILLKPPAQAALEGQINKLARMMEDARAPRWPSGAIVGKGLEDENEAEPGRMTIGEAVRKSSFEKLTGVVREELRAAEQRERSKRSETKLAESMAKLTITPYPALPGPSKEDEFAACLGVPRAVIDELKVAIGEAEFDIWFAKRLSVKAAIVKQRLELNKAEAQQRYQREQEALRQQLNRQVREAGAAGMFYLDGITGPQTVRKKPQPKASKQPAVLIGAPRRYFNEE